MVIELAKSKTFEPGWGGNREKPESERIRVHYRFVTAGEKRKFRYFEPVAYNMDTGRAVEKKRNYIEDRPGLVQAVVTRIENLEIKLGEEKISVNTGAKLYNTPLPDDLVMEIELEVNANADPEIDSLPLG